MQTLTDCVPVLAPSLPAAVQFFTRPFVDGDSVLVQAAGGLTVSGVVERTTIMRTTLRTDDDVVVTIPNKVCAA